VRAQTVALPRRGRRAPASAGRLRRLAPSARSLLVGLAIAAFAGGAYAAARETSVFAVRSVDVTGAPPAVAAQVSRALAPLLGSSLVVLDGAALERRVDAIPSVEAVSYDRAFPHTLRIEVVPERSSAVVRSGSASWLVSARGRLVARIAPRSEPGLPRIWLPAAATLASGAFLPSGRGGSAAAALALASRFPAGIHSASFAGDALVFHLHSGLELRLGTPTDIRLKLAVARRALRLLPPGSTYLDVSVPGRPVSGADAASSTNPQVSSGG